MDGRGLFTGRHLFKKYFKDLYSTFFLGVEVFIEKGTVFGKHVSGALPIRGGEGAEDRLIGFFCKLTLFPGFELLDPVSGFTDLEPDDEPGVYAGGKGCRLFSGFLVKRYRRKEVFSSWRLDGSRPVPGINLFEDRFQRLHGEILIGV